MLLFVVLGVLICANSQAQLTTNAYEGFNYSSGPLAGQNGGTGWSSAWVKDYGSGSTLQVSTTGLTYPGLTTTGGSAVWGSGGNGISEDSRSLSLLDSGIVYVQFLCKFGTSSGGGTPNLRFYNSTSMTGGIGANGGTYGSTISILNTSLNPALDGSSTTTASLSSLNLVVARIDYQNAMTELWVNPSLSTYNYQNPTNPDATYAGLAPAFNKVAFDTRNPGNVDELTIMSEPVPEPASIALFVAGLGVLLLGWRWRQRKY